jgi:hypothetical protein
MAAAGPRVQRPGKQPAVRGRYASSSIEDARRNLEAMKLKVKKSKHFLSVAAHKLLIEGMGRKTFENPVGLDPAPSANVPLAHACMFLNDLELYNACDARKYKRTDANSTYKPSDPTSHSRFEVNGKLMQSIECTTTKTNKIDLYGQFNLFADQGLPFSATNTIPDLDKHIALADEHITDNPRYVSVIFPTSDVTWAGHNRTHLKVYIHTYLTSAGVQQEIIKKYFVDQIINMSQVNESGVVWEPNPTVLRHKAADYEIAVTEHRGSIQDTVHSEHSEYKVFVNRRMVMAGLRNLKGRKFVLCEEIIIQLMKRHDDAVAEHIQFHSTNHALIFIARPLQPHPTSAKDKPNNTHTHFFGTNAFSVNLTENPALDKIDRAECAMFTAGWILKQLQNITSQNSVNVGQAERFFGNMGSTTFNNGLKARRKERLTILKAQQKIPADFDIETEPPYIALLRESFLSQQNATDVITVKENIHPKIKLWYPAPSFAVIVISPVDRPDHNYIIVQTFACRDKDTQANMIIQKKTRVFQDLAISDHKPQIHDYKRSDSGHFTVAPGPPLASKFASDVHCTSRLPPELELELQLL